MQGNYNTFMHISCPRSASHQLMLCARWAGVYDPFSSCSGSFFFSFLNRDRYVSISSSFFSQAFGHGGEIGSGVECWRGYYQSLRATQMGLSLNIGIVVVNSLHLKSQDTRILLIITWKSYMYYLYVRY